MKEQTEYIGIDYGSYTGTNRNSRTGIHYGVISQNSVMPEALDDILEHGVDSAWENAIADLKKEHGEGTEAYESAVEEMGNQWETEFNNYVYERNGYKLTGCLQNDLFILDSPYYTHAQFCSPCVPGAGNLNHPCKTGPKTYCLGAGWFDDGKAPYPIYEVQTGELAEL